MIPTDVLGAPTPANTPNVNIPIRVGDNPLGIAVNPNNDLIYVSNSGSDTVSVIDSTTNKVLLNNITVGDSPRSIAVNTNNNLVYVSNSGSETVSVINGTTNKVL